MAIIELDAVRFRWKPQLPDTLYLESLCIEQGEHVFIQGASGTGKTTLLNMLAGILLPTAGRVQLMGQAVNQLSGAARDQLRADYMGIIFQQFNLLPYLSVQENVMLPCRFSKRRAVQAGELHAASQRLLEHLGLQHVLRKSVTELSVGQQQRVAVARALMGRPELIIADEPTSALDTDTRDEFLELLFQEAQAQGSTVVFVSHDAHIAKYFPRVVNLGLLNQVKVEPSH